MTTNLVIRGVEYDLEDTFQNAQLNVLLFMAKRLGVTLKTITQGLADIDRRSRIAEHERDLWELRVDAGEDLDGVEPPPSDDDVMIEMISTEDGVDLFRGIVWLAKTQAGDRNPAGGFLTLDEAAEGVGFRDVRFVNDDEVDGDAVPKGEPRESATSSSSTTSEPTSTPVSA